MRAIYKSDTYLQLLLSQVWPSCQLALSCRAVAGRERGERASQTRTRAAVVARDRELQIKHSFAGVAVAERLPLPQRQ